MSSGLAGEVVSDEDALTPPGLEAQEEVDDHDEAIDEVDAIEIDLTAAAVAVPVPVSEPVTEVESVAEVEQVVAVEPVAEVEPVAAEPAWQLSPPPAVVPEVEPAAEAEACR